MSLTLSTEQRSEVREIARAEVASLCGLVLRRLQDHDSPTRSFERNAATDELQSTLNAIFGEALADFSGEDDEPGEDDA